MVRNIEDLVLLLHTVVLVKALMSLAIIDANVFLFIWSTTGRIRRPPMNLIPDHFNNYFEVAPAVGTKYSHSCVTEGYASWFNNGTNVTDTTSYGYSWGFQDNIVESETIYQCVMAWQDEPELFYAPFNMMLNVLVQGKKV